MMKGPELALPDSRREGTLLYLQGTIDAQEKCGPIGVAGFWFGESLAWEGACELNGSRPSWSILGSESRIRSKARQAGGP